MSLPRALAALLLVLALGLAGCSAPAATTADAGSGGGPAATPDAPAEGDAGDGTTDLPSDDGGGAAAECGPALPAIDTVITDQLDAFAAGDWQRAFSHTSSEFRAAGVDADGLREIVTNGYPVAADAAEHRIVGCLGADGERQVLIEVTGADGATADLVYLMVREDGTWRVSGAVQHGSGPSEPSTTTA